MVTVSFPIENLESIRPDLFLRISNCFKFVWINDHFIFGEPFDCGFRP